jgi:hypothetical protein
MSIYPNALASVGSAYIVIVASRPASPYALFSLHRRACLFIAKKTWVEMMLATDG